MRISIRPSLALSLACGMVAVSSVHAANIPIISDGFNIPNWTNVPIVGRTPPTSTPASSFVKIGQPNYLGIQQNPNDVLFSKAGFQNYVGAAISIQSAGSYTKPATLAISGDLSPWYAGLSGTSGVGLGFYSSSIPLHNGTYTPNPLTAFTGLRLMSTGDLVLFENGVAGTSIAFAGGTFNGSAFTTLSYEINTGTGAISNVQLAGSTATYNYSSTAFTDAATQYAGFFNVGGQNSNGALDNFAVAEVVPEPASLAVIGMLGGAMLRRRRN